MVGSRFPASLAMLALAGIMFAGPAAAQSAPGSTAAATAGFETLARALEALSRAAGSAGPHLAQAARVAGPAAQAALDAARPELEAAARAASPALAAAAAKPPVATDPGATAGQSLSVALGGMAVMLDGLSDAMAASAPHLGRAIDSAAPGLEEARRKALPELKKAGEAVAAAMETTR